MNLQTYIFTITGIRPLLMHSPKAMSKPRDAGGKLGVKKIPSEVEEAEANAYRLDSGELYFPGMNVRAAIVGPGGAAAGMKFGKITAAQAFCSGAFVFDEPCVLRDPKTKKPLLEYERDVRRVMVQKNGVQRSRPKLLEWEFSWRVEIDSDFMAPSGVLALLRRAGRVAGLGDFRPQKKGPFGMFWAEPEDEATRLACDEAPAKAADKTTAKSGKAVR